jgi:Fe-S-cluster-containing dehydrogenase component
MKKWTMIIDIAKCHKCNNCLMACKDEFVDNDWSPLSAEQPQHGHYWMNLHSTERGSYPLVDVAYLPQPCMHCEKPDCLKAAKNGAIYQRDDGIVIIDPEKAKGQKDLVDACPYGSIYWNDKLAIPQKCTMCAHLLDEGWTQPRCVQACPTGALTFVQEDVSGEAGLEDFHPEFGTSPIVKYKNLYRYTASLVCGSVALTDINECAENAVVKLASGGKEIAETTTNNYGDFKFDGLPAEGGSYTVTVAYDGRAEKSLSVESGGSVNLGVIYL